MIGPQTSDAPRTSRRRAVVVLAAGLLIVGAAIGGLWAWIAPPIHGVVALTHEGDRLHDYLGDESEHFFVAPTWGTFLASISIAMVTYTGIETISNPLPRPTASVKTTAEYLSGAFRTPF